MLIWFEELLNIKEEHGLEATSSDPIEEQKKYHEKLEELISPNLRDMHGKHSQNNYQREVSAPPFQEIIAHQPVRKAWIPNQLRV